MPIDKQPKGPTNKPVTPALSSRFRTANTVVAPRLAGSAQASPATTTRRDLREQTLSPQAEQNKARPLNDNVTPRSGARNARISTDSPSSPGINRRFSGTGSILSTISSAQKGPNNSSPRNYNLGQVRPGVKAGSPRAALTRKTSTSSIISKKDEATTKFIRANDAKSMSSFQSPKSTLSPRPFSTSIASNEGPRSTKSAPPSNTGLQNDKKDHNFVRANDAHIRTGRSPLMVRKQSATSVTSVNSVRTRSPELSRTQSHQQLRPQPTNQSSPGKIIAAITNKSTSPHKQPIAQSSPTVGFSSSPSDRRRSFGSNILNSLPERPILHRKSASVSSFDPPFPKSMTPAQAAKIQHLDPTWLSPTVAIPLQHSLLAASTPDTLSPRSASLASSKTIGTSVTSDTDVSEVSKTGLSFKVASPIDASLPQNQLNQTQPSPLAQAQMQAANARRERKVLDLEISNSSLLAINKTLEKELRKQSAELRRFRRLSRSGRISFAPSNRSVSGQSAISLDTLQEQSEDDVDYSDEEEEEEESDLEEIDEDIGDSLQTSPGGSTARERRRARDEHRLMLDLSKHQQLLVDSQKLTTSIRKCLNMSESLIKEANQALKYKVGIGDLKLGGRVLSAEDEMDHGPENIRKQQELPRQGLLSPSIATAQLEEAALWLTQISGQDQPPDPYTPELSEPD